MSTVESLSQFEVSAAAEVPRRAAGRWPLSDSSYNPVDSRGTLPPTWCVAAADSVVQQQLEEYICNSAVFFDPFERQPLAVR